MRAAHVMSDQGVQWREARSGMKTFQSGLGLSQSPQVQQHHRNISVPLNLL